MMILIHHRLTTASKPAAKHAKPSSLKYADTTNRKTDLKKKYTDTRTHRYSTGKAYEGVEEARAGMGERCTRGWTTKCSALDTEEKPRAVRSRLEK